MFDAVVRTLTRNPAVGYPDLKSVYDISASEYCEILDLLRRDKRYLQQLATVHPNNWRRFQDAASPHSSFWAPLFSGADPLPEELEFHPSFTCPFKCWYCCSPHPYSEQTVDLDERNSRVAAYLEQLQRHLKCLQISGGREPLFDRTLPRFLNRISSEVSIRINTSGYAVSPETALSSVGDHFSYIAVSLDAPNQELYSRIKGCQCETAFRSITSDIREYLKTRRRNNVLELVVLVLPENRSVLEQMIEHAMELGADSIRFRRLKLHTVRQGYLHPHCDPPEEDAWAYRSLHVLEDLQHKYSLPNFRVNINTEDFCLQYRTYIADNSGNCYSSRRKIVIDANGNVHPCALLSYPDACGQLASTYNANIMRFLDIRALWLFLKPERMRLFSNACKVCLVADRYINNFATKLARDQEQGVPILGQPFGGGL